MVEWLPSEPVAGAARSAVPRVEQQSNEASSIFQKFVRAAQDISSWAQFGRRFLSASSRLIRFRFRQAANIRCGRRLCHSAEAIPSDSDGDAMTIAVNNVHIYTSIYIRCRQSRIEYLALWRVGVEEAFGH